MKYYARKEDGPPISGPFTVDEIKAKLAAGEMGRDWVVTGDLGESHEQLLRTPPRDWTPLDSICSPEDFPAVTLSAASPTSTSEPRSANKNQISQSSSLQMKPRAFGQVFGQAAPLLGGGFFLLLYLLNVEGVRYSDKQTVQLFVGSLFFGIVMGLVAAYYYRGEIIVRECDDPKKLLQTLAVRLAENRYNLESQTEALHTFKPPFDRWLGGRVYIISEGLKLRIVGPAYVMKKLRNV